MTTLIIITLAFLTLIMLTFVFLISFCIHEVYKENGDSDTVLLGMLSVAGLIWSIVSLITFYKVLA